MTHQEYTATLKKRYKNPVSISHYTQKEIENSKLLIISKNKTLNMIFHSMITLPIFNGICGIYLDLGGPTLPEKIEMLKNFISNI